MSLRRSTRMLLAALGVWIGASIAAILILPASPLVGLVVAGVGGGAFGVMSARRVDSRKVRVRKRRGGRSRGRGGAGGSDGSAVGSGGAGNGSGGAGGDGDDGDRSSDAASSGSGETV